MTARYARVVASGFLRPCSHSWSVLGLMQKARANCACDIRALVRMSLTSTSPGRTTRRVGSIVSPFTWASISLALCFNAIPSLVRLLDTKFKLRTPNRTPSPVAHPLSKASTLGIRTPKDSRPLRSRPAIRHCRRQRTAPPPPAVSKPNPAEGPMRH